MSAQNNWYISRQCGLRKNGMTSRGSLTAQKAGLVEIFPLALHFLSEVHGLLAAATLISSSQRHSAELQWRVSSLHRNGRHVVPSVGTPTEFGGVPYI